MQFPGIQEAQQKQQFILPGILPQFLNKQAAPIGTLGPLFNPAQVADQAAKESSESQEDSEKSEDNENDDEEDIEEEAEEEEDNSKE